MGGAVEDVRSDADRRVRNAFIALSVVVIGFYLGSAAVNWTITPLFDQLDPPYLIMAFASFAVILRTCRRSVGDSRAVWGFIGAFVGLSAVGDLIFVSLEALGSSPSLSPADALYLLGYPFLLVGLWRIARGRAGGTGVQSMVDGLLIALGFGLLAWEVLVVAPANLDSNIDAIGRFVLVAYPITDLLMLGAAAGIVLLARRIDATLAWIIAYLVAMVVADFSYTIAASSAEQLLPWIDVAYAAAYVLVGLAALSREATTVAARRASQVDSRGARFVLLGVAVSAPAITAAIVLWIGAEISVPVLLVTTAALAVLIALRVADAVRTAQLAQQGAEAAQERLRVQSRVDALTGLPNRMALLESVRARTGPIALLFVDIDRFKQVNDTSGHAVGDEVLQEIARRIKEGLEHGDVAYRLGGDEFVVVVPGDLTDAALDERAFTQLTPLNEPFVAQGVEWHLGASIGGARVGPPNHRSETDEADDLLRRADMAMYQAKRDPTTAYRAFDDAMQRQLEDRHRLELELRSSLARNEFEPAFQPIVDLQSGEVHGFEALARWRPAGGQLRPAIEFIDVAEQAGLLVGIEQQVVDRAFRFMARWRERHLDRADGYVAINLSPTELVNQDLIMRLETGLAAAGISASNIVIELTEGALVQAPDSAAFRLGELRDMGFRIALDDFGTGFSSLSHLRRFPVDIVKIDRSFVMELTPTTGPSSVAAATCRLAETLGLEVVAEGVETAEQVAVLRSLGVRWGQGYFFARPLEASDAERLDRAGQSTR